MNDPTREYYKVYEIKNYRNTIEGINWTSLNLPNEYQTGRAGFHKGQRTHVHIL